MHDSTKIEIKIALHGKTTVFFLCCKTWHIYIFIYFFFLIRYLAAGCPTKRVWLARLLLVGEWKKSDCTVKYGNSKQEIKWIENSPSIIIYDRRGEYPKVKCVCVFNNYSTKKTLGQNFGLTTRWCPFSTSSRAKKKRRAQESLKMRPITDIHAKILFLTDGTLLDTNFNHGCNVFLQKDATKEKLREKQKIWRKIFGVFQTHQFGKKKTWRNGVSHLRVLVKECSHHPRKMFRPTTKKKSKMTLLVGCSPSIILL